MTVDGQETEEAGTHLSIVSSDNTWIT
jgi:hypothetical protein